MYDYLRVLSTKVSNKLYPMLATVFFINSYIFYERSKIASMSSSYEVPELKLPPVSPSYS